MEVHHHSHTSRKKWTHYFWEFIMLFLAVFCGFLAENQREHFVEHNRAKDFAGLLYQDLKNDTLYFNQVLSSQVLIMQHADSLLGILNSDNYDKSNHKMINHLMHVTALMDFKPAFPVNFEQIKNSGSLRYFKNKPLVSSLSALDRLLKSTEEVFNKNNEFILQNLTPFVINNLNTAHIDFFSKTILVSNPVIFDWNNRTSTVLANKVNLKRTYGMFLINQFLKPCIEKARELITSLKKEFHIK